MAILQNPYIANLVGKAGKAIDVVGKATQNFRLPTPELGLSEKMQSFGGYFNPRPAYAAESSQYITDYGNQNVQYPGPISPTGGGGSPTPTYSQLPQEQVPSGPAGMDDLDAAINQGMQALSQYEGTLAPTSEVMINEAQSTFEQGKRGAETEGNRRLGEYSGQRTEEQGRTEGTISQARRLGSQMMQGIQSLYGGSTGTGQFASEILGSQVSQNIATNQAALQGTLSKISQAEGGVKDWMTNQIQTLNENLTTEKERARTWLNQALAEVASKKAELASSKAEMRMQALQSYQGLVADINARNTAAKQDAYTRAQEAAAKLETFGKSAMEKYQAALQGFQPKMWNVGDQQVGAFPTPSGGIEYIKGKYTNPTTGTTEDDDFVDA